MLSVIILAHGKSSLTDQCLEALTKAEGDLDVLLVDNASPDDTPAVARAYEGRLARFRHYRSADNFSFAIANNAAVRETSGDVLLFLNNDVMVSPDAPMRLHQAVRDTRGGIAGAKLVYPDTGTIQHAGMRQMLWGYASNLGTGARSGEPVLNRTGDIFAVTGAMLAIDRSLFDRIRGFDERYRWGYEDVDLCLKARAAGAAVRYIAEAECVHAESATLAAVRESADLSANYGLYRRLWDDVLIPNEHAAIARLRDAGISRVAVFGTGLAATGLSDMLARNGIEIAAFTASTVERGEFRGRPVVPLEELSQTRYDRLVVASQHFYALRERLAPFDPLHAPIFPVADGSITEA